MPYPQAPQYPNTQNGWQTLGAALTQGGQIVDKFQADRDADEEKRQRLQMLMQDMVQKKQAATMAQIEADRKTAEETAKAKREQDFRDAMAGPVISPTLAANPSLSQSAPIIPGGPTQAELADLGNVQGLNLPAQSVTAGGDSTAFMGAALNRQPADMANGRTLPTQDEILQAGLKYGQMDQAGKYAQAVKDLREKPADYFNNPALQADFMTKAQDPTFQKLAAGYAKDPQRFGPAVQNWATRNGYSGQKWWNTELDNMIHQNPLSLVNKDQTSPNDIEYWAQQYADGKIDPGTLGSFFSSRGGGKAELMAKITARAQELNPDVNVAKDIGDFGASKDKRNKLMLASIENVKTRMGRLQDLSSSIDRTRFPTLNAWIQSGEKGVGDMNATLLALNEKLTGEELTPIFGGGTAGSNAKMDLALQVSALGKLPVEVAIAKVKELSDALDTRKKTYLAQQGRYAPNAGKSGDTIKSSSGKTSVTFH